MKTNRLQAQPDNDQKTAANAPPVRLPVPAHKLEKYTTNLRIEGFKVISYSTHVATIQGCNLVQLGWWSVTTQKHINYVASKFNLTIIIK